MARFVKEGKAKLRNLWLREYKDLGGSIVRNEVSPEPLIERSYIDSVLDQLAPALPLASRSRSSARKDQLTQYLEEAPTDQPLIAYWLSKEAQWPQLF